MKERLNLTIDSDLLEAIKAYAASRQTSVSELVEQYFRSVTRPGTRKTVVDMVDGLDRPVELRVGKVEMSGDRNGEGEAKRVYCESEGRAYAV